MIIKVDLAHFTIKSSVADLERLTATSSPPDDQMSKREENERKTKRQSKVEPQVGSVMEEMCVEEVYMYIS